MYMYSSDQMQGISLMRSLLATNVFIADNKHVYRWREMRLVIEQYTISDVYKRVYRWRRTQLKHACIIPCIWSVLYDWLYTLNIPVQILHDFYLCELLRLYMVA